MARYNAMEEHFEEITVLDKPALFTGIRIERETVPKGLYLYEVRGDDDGGGDPVQIARGIMVNHFGSIITHEPIKLPPDGKGISGEIPASKEKGKGTGKIGGEARWQKRDLTLSRSCTQKP